jgi:hypothetical protein
MPSRIGCLIAAALLCVCTSCRDQDWPAYRAPIVLQAYTSSAASAGATDSIVCSIYVNFPIDDSIPTAWSGQADVRVSRWTLRGTPGLPKDTALAGVPVEIASLGADSMRVRIGGSAPMTFEGKFIGSDAAYSRDATGQWTCDDRVPLSQSVPGRATGVWYLFVERPID